MPYIKKEDREEFKNWLATAPLVGTPGELNYVITNLCLDYIRKTNYETLNSIVGVLECVKQEFYRRAVSSYEDEKIKENGDVY